MTEDSFPDGPTTLHRWDDLHGQKITDSLTRRLVTGERMMLAHLRLDQGARVPMHSHENEQFSWVLEGALRFVIGGGPDDADGRQDGGSRNAEEDQSGEEGRNPDLGRTLDQGREILVRTGEVLHLPSNVPHSAEAVEDTVAVDIFSPPRREWLEGDP